MSERVANCPNCGAPVKFLWSSAVQTTCEFCRSILVRRDVDLERVGEIADLPPDSSPLQISSEGVYSGKSFVVVGRILYEFEQGGWNEWHVVFNDGKSGWLSDAQLEYDVSFMTPPPGALPVSESIVCGASFQWSGARYDVTSVTRAHYKGVQGELPFEYWDKSDVLFVDLRTTSGRFGTIDYSDKSPLLFLGEAVEFDDLHLKNLREFEGWK
jgi:Domain of unknown function (DUF4178)